MPQSALSTYHKIYHTALKSNHEVSLHSLEAAHKGFSSLLHKQANNPSLVDWACLSYCLARLPECIDTISALYLGQNTDLFCQNNCNVDSWKPQTTTSRRRKMFLDKEQNILNCYIASISDIDDLLTTTVAFQIEWNKLHLLLKSQPLESLGNPSQIEKFKKDLGQNYPTRLELIKSKLLSIRVRLLASSWIDYTRSTQSWWKQLAAFYSQNTQKHLSGASVYFISSNTHTLLNLITTLPLSYDPHPNLSQKPDFMSTTDYLYFQSQGYKSDPIYQEALSESLTKLKILVTKNQQALDLTTQIIPVSSLSISPLDPDLKIPNIKRLQSSKSIIINIDYPLGFLAYHVLNETLENVGYLKGIYIMGKAAILNGQPGDIQVPRTVYDEHSKNSYIFHNCFNHYLPFVNNQGSILTNQKAASVLGTFLQNQELLDEYQKNNISLLEMESGPFLGAATEATYQDRLPQDTIIDLNQAPFDIGIINYASDNPIQDQTLGSIPSLHMAGVEPTYLAGRAILQRIINLESE